MVDGAEAVAVVAEPSAGAELLPLTSGVVLVGSVRFRAGPESPDGPRAPGAAASQHQRPLPEEQVVDDEATPVGAGGLMEDPVVP